MEIKIYTQEFKQTELISFFHHEELGWCFDYYPDDEHKERDCLMYETFPQSFIEVSTNYEKYISEFLIDKPKTYHEIDINEFFIWLNKKPNE